MKETIIVMKSVKIYILLILFLLVIGGKIFAQEKASVRLDLTSHILNNGLPELRAQVRTRIDRRYQPVEKVKVYFFHTEMEDQYLLGTSESNEDGYASLTLGDQFKAKWDTTKNITFYATISDNPDYEDNDDDIEIVKGEINVELIEDEPNEVEVSISKYDEEGMKVPASEVEVRVQVKRTFGVLPIGETYETDEDGKFSVEFPAGIPGENGNLTIIVFVEDDSEMGYLKYEQQAPWGTAVEEDNSEFNQRSLWATRNKAPYWLLIFPNLIILGIWGTMIYLVWMIFRINKIGKSH